MGADLPENKLPFDISLKGELKGEVPSTALGRAVHALVDAVSPFTEGMGLVGDHIRVHRYNVVTNIALRAREMAKENGIDISSPPLKFMVPFLEKASTEEEDSEICELWSRLLLDACDEFQGVHLTYIQILSEISGAEARYIDELGKNYSIDYSPYSASIMSKNFLAGMIVFLDGDRHNPRVIDKFEAEDVIKKALSYRSEEMCMPTMVSVQFGKGGNYQGFVVQADRSTIAYLLARQNLVSIEHVEESTSFGRLKLEVACLTPLGMDFVTSCMGRG